MRTVYVDVLVVVNIFIDFLLLLGTGRFLQLKSKLLRLILASLLGGAQSLVALLPEIPAALNILLDLLFASALVLIAFGKADFRSFLKRTLVFFGVSFFFCGIMVFIYSAFRPKGMEVYNDVVYFNISPILLIILTLICYYIMRVLRKLTMGETGKRLCTVKLGIAGEAIEFRVGENAACVGKPLRELKLRPNTLIAAVIRGSKSILPDGGTVIQPGDHAIVVSAAGKLQTLDDIVL